MRRIRVLLIVVGIMMTFGSFAIAGVVDVIQAPTGFFVPTDGQKYDDTYWRWFDEDWGWSHNALLGTFTTATLGISAFDVDAPSEVDKIYVGPNALNLTYIGNLAGADDVWNYSTFDVSAFGAAIATGLYVFIDIDTTHTQDWWAVTLAKSVLSLDGGTPPPPQPGPVPEPSTLLLLGSSLIGLGYFVRKRMKK